MCYSFKSSIISYTIGMITSIIAMKTGQVPLGFLILFYCQIQLAEGIIWRGIDTDNLSLNKIGTNIAKYTLALHMLGLGIGIYIIYKEPIPLIIGALFFLFVCIYYYSNYSNNTSYTFPYKECQKREKRECQNPDNRLVWKFPVQWYKISAIISFVLYFIYVKNDSVISRLFIISFFIITAILSEYLYPKETYAPSLWCFISAIVAPIMIFINYYLK